MVRKWQRGIRAAWPLGLREENLRKMEMGNSDKNTEGDEEARPTNNGGFGETDIWGQLYKCQARLPVAGTLVRRGLRSEWPGFVPPGIGCRATTQ